MENPNQRGKLRHERKRPMGGVQQSLAHAKQFDGAGNVFFRKKAGRTSRSIPDSGSLPQPMPWERYPKDASQPCHPSPTA